MMRAKFLAVTTILVIVSLACTISVDLPASSPGELRTFTIDEPLPAGEEGAQLRIEMGGGTLEISGGSQSLVSGTIAYNLAEWEPQVRRDGGSVRIRQNVRSLPLPRRKSNIINRWELQLGGTPVDLQIDAGAYEGTFDLSGIPLTRLGINSGASNAVIRFDTPNPERMTFLEFRTGASNVEITGLGHANFAEMIFRGAAGSYSLDFSGTLREPARAVIDGAVGDMTILIPADQAVQVAVTGGLRNVSTQGEWQIDDNNYSAGSGEPLLEITINMSVGNLRLVRQ